MRKRTKRLTLRIITNICRLLLAITFIFSGFIKANDPYGTVYKLEDYLAAMGGIQIPEFIVIVMAIGLAFVEFTMGIYLFFGINRKKISRWTVLFMTLMTLLTIWIYLFNPVSDCGCFGDAIILSNGETLAKNIVLLACAIFLKRYSKLQTEFVADRFKWMISVVSMIAILLFSVHCIIKLPFIDFRPFKVHTDLRANYESYSNPENFEVKIVYEKDGKTMELDLDDDDPDSTWTYVETRRTIKNEQQLETSNFYFSDAETEEDVTEDILYNDAPTLLLIIPDLNHADESCIDRVNEIYEYAKNNHLPFYCLTGSGDKEAQTYWNEHTGAEYPYFIGDERLLKTIVRANPGLVLLHHGIIKKKWSNFTFDVEKVGNFLASFCY